MDIDPPLEAIGRVGGKSRAGPGPPHAGRVERRALDEQIDRVFRHLRVEPSHDPREGDRAIAVGDHRLFGREPVLLAVERRQRLARHGRAHADLRSRQPREIEGVQRLVVLVQDVVRRVDDVADRTRPHREQPAREPRRRRPDPDPPDDGGHVARTPAEILDADRDPGPARLRLAVAPLGRPRRPAEVARRRGASHFPRDPDVAGEVDPVRIQIQREARIGQAQRRRERRSRLEPVREPHDAPLVAAQLEFGLRAQHAVTQFTADLPALDAEAGGELPPRRHVRIESSGRDDGGPAHDVEHLAGAPVHPAQREPVRVRVRTGLQHAGHDDPVQPRAHRLDLLHRGGGHRQAFGQTLRVAQLSAQSDEFVDPVERDVHANCCRKLISPS